MLLLISNPTAESSRDVPSSNHVNLCVSVGLEGWRGRSPITHLFTVTDSPIKRPAEEAGRPLTAAVVTCHRTPQASVWTLTKSK